MYDILVLQYKVIEYNFMKTTNLYEKSKKLFLLCCSSILLYYFLLYCSSVQKLYKTTVFVIHFRIRQLPLDFHDCCFEVSIHFFSI